MITAPEPLRAQLRELSTAELVAAVARLRPGPNFADPTRPPRRPSAPSPTGSATSTPRSPRPTNLIDPLVADRAPRLIALFGVGPYTAAQLLITAGDNPDRLHTAEAVSSPLRRRPHPGQPPAAPTDTASTEAATASQPALHTIAITRIRSRPRNPRLHRPHHHHQDQKRHPPHPQALHRPPALHPPHQTRPRNPLKPRDPTSASVILSALLRRPDNCQIFVPPTAGVTAGRRPPAGPGLDPGEDGTIVGSRDTAHPLSSQSIRTTDPALDKHRSVGTC